MADPWNFSKILDHSLRLKIKVSFYFQSSISTDNNKLKTTISLPKSNVLIFTTNDGTKVALRPSGTEPKIKFYISVNGKVDDKHNYSNLEDKLENKINRVISELKIH